MSTPNMILVAAGVAVGIGLLIWTVDHAAVHRWLGEVPSWYWRRRYEIRSAVGGLLDVSQIYALIGIAFIGLSMWAHRHPHVWKSNNWPPPGWVRTVTVYDSGVFREGAYLSGETKPSERGPVNDFGAPPSWEVSNAGGNGRELQFKRYIQIEEGGYSYWSESVAIKVRPYWAWHVWPRTYYRLEVGFIGEDALVVDSDNGNWSTRPGARVHVTFRSGEASYGPINMEKAVTNNSGVSYNYGAIRRLLEFMERNPGPLKVHVALSLNGKPVGTREFDAPKNLTAKRVTDTYSVWEARR